MKPSFLGELKKKRKKHKARDIKPVEYKVFCFLLPKESKAVKVKCDRCNKLIAIDEIHTHQNSSHSAKILENLFLGSENNAKNVKELERSNITDIINCATEIKDFYPDKYSYHGLKCNDYSSERDKVLDLWREGYAVFEEVRKKNGSLLIHCQQGISRSSSMVIAILMIHNKMDLQTAHDHVFRKRTIVKPNAGFWQKLCELEMELFGQNTVTPPSMAAEIGKVLVQDPLLVFRKKVAHLETQNTHLKQIVYDQRDMISQEDTAIQVMLTAIDQLKIVLKPEASVGIIIDEVLGTMNRQDPGSVLKKSIIQHIGGEKSSLPDNKWDSMPVPLMLQLYLKTYLAQSSLCFVFILPVMLTKLEVLQCDMNNGKELNLNLYKGNVDLLTNMGIPKSLAFEACVVLGNPQPQDACDYVFLPAEERNLAYRNKMAQYAQSISYLKLQRVIDHIKALRTQKSQMQHKMSNASSAKLKQTLMTLKQKLADTVKEADRLAESIKDLGHKTHYAQYESFLKGVSCDGALNPLEIQNIQRFQKELDITDGEHEKILKSIGYTTEAWEKIKHAEEVVHGQHECILCFEPQLDYVFLDCMHFCLCAECHKEGEYNVGDQCPVCEKEIKKILNVKI